MFRSRGHSREGRPVRLRGWLPSLAVAVVVIALASFPLGTVGITPDRVVTVLWGGIVGHGPDVTAIERTVVLDIRLPRILGALLVGAGLAAAGAAYQSMFRNPLVSPAILGVSAGAGFGAALGLLLRFPWPAVQLMAFAGGLAAAGAAVGISRLLGGGSMVVLVLAGVVVSTLFQAFISITQYLANPIDTLPTITFWLMGGLGRIGPGDLLWPSVILGVSLAALYAVRWPISVLAAGEEEALTLGVNRRLVWFIVIGAATLMTSTAVSLAGIVGWIGLIVPHLARFAVGPSFDRLLPTSVLMGAGLLVLIDDVARSATRMELPLGVLTALIGAPFFVLLLTRARKQWL